MEIKQKIVVVEKAIESLHRKCPPLIARRMLPQYLGGAISVGTLANAESGGYGPPCIRNGRNVIYERESFLEWFKVYLEGGMQKVKSTYHQRE